MKERIGDLCYGLFYPLSEDRRVKKNRKNALREREDTWTKFEEITELTINDASIKRIMIAEKKVLDSQSELFLWESWKEPLHSDIAHLYVIDWIRKSSNLLNASYPRSQGDYLEAGLIYAGRKNEFLENKENLPQNVVDRRIKACDIAINYLVGRSAVSTSA